MAIGNTKAAGTASGPHIAPAVVHGQDEHLDAPGTMSQSGTVDAGGVCTLPFVPPAPSGAHVDVELVVVVSDSAGASTARIYVAKVGAEGLRDLTRNGNEDVAFEQPPIYLPSDTPLIVQWTGADPGATCTATIQYRMRG